MRYRSLPPHRSPAQTIWVLLLCLMLVSCREEVGDQQGQKQPQEKEGAQQLKVMTWNICGGNPGNCTKANGFPDENRPAYRKADAVIETIEKKDLDAVLLQEVCYMHVERLVDRLGKEWGVHFTPTGLLENGDIKAATCKVPRNAGDPERDSAYGIATLVKGKVTHQYFPMVEFTRDDPQDKALLAQDLLPSPAGTEEQRPVLCVRAEKPRLQVCNAHFSGVDYTDWHKKQASKVAELQRRGTSAGYASIVGGDFNSQSRGSDLAVLYSQGEECDAKDADGRSNEDTQGSHFITNKKIDYIFADQSTRWTACAVDKKDIAIDYSDHWQLIGWLRIPSTSTSKAPEFQPETVSDLLLDQEDITPTRASDGLRTGQASSITEPVVVTCGRGKTVKAPKGSRSGEVEFSGSPDRRTNGDLVTQSPDIDLRQDIVIAPISFIAEQFMSNLAAAHDACPTKVAADENQFFNQTRTAIPLKHAGWSGFLEYNTTQNSHTGFRGVDIVIVARKANAVMAMSYQVQIVTGDVQAMPEDYTKDEQNLKPRALEVARIALSKIDQSAEG